MNQAPVGARYRASRSTARSRFGGRTDSAIPLPSPEFAGIIFQTRCRICCAAYMRAWISRNRRPRFAPRRHRRRCTGIRLPPRFRCKRSRRRLHCVHRQRAPHHHRSGCEFGTHDRAGLPPVPARSRPPTERELDPADRYGRFVAMYIGMNQNDTRTTPPRYGRETSACPTATGLRDSPSGSGKGGAAPMRREAARQHGDGSRDVPTVHVAADRRDAAIGEITYQYYTLKKALYAAAQFLATQQGVNFCGDTTGRSRPRRISA